MPSSLLTVIFIVWILVPGTLFKRFYFQGFFTKQFRSGDFADRVVTSVFLGVIIQLLTFGIYYAFDSIDSNVEKSIERIYNDLAQNRISELKTIDPFFWLGYIMAVLFISMASGLLTHQIVRIFKLDTKYKVFRFTNHWHYYLMGDITSLNNHTSTKRTGKWISTQADIVIKQDREKPKLISGHISDYFISLKTGELESIVLRNAQRWCIESEAFKPIPGDALLVPYGNIMDMNLTYATKGVDPWRRNRFKILFINAFLGVGILFSMIFPFFTTVNILRKIFGIFLLFLVALFSTIILEILIQVDRRFIKEGNQTDRKASEIHKRSHIKMVRSMLKFTIPLVFIAIILAALTLDQSWLWNWIF